MDPFVTANNAHAKDAAMRNPEVLERLRQNSIFPTPGTPEQWPAYLRAESTKWGELIRARGITAE
jgi:tripartite-type tricarboxylate transporter receptor subunit TctC